MKRFTVRAATILLLILAFLACWHFSRPAPRSYPAAFDSRHVPAATAVAGGPRPARNRQPAAPLPPATRPPIPYAQTAPQSGISAFTDFSRWAEQFLAGVATAS